MCSYLEWQLNVEPKMLSEFEAKVKRDFKGTVPYPNYALPSPAPSPIPSTTPYTTTRTTTTNNAPSFVTGRAPSTSPPKPMPRPPVAHSTVPSAPGHAPPEQLYLRPPSSPGSPDTPKSSRRLQPQRGSKITARRSRPLAIPSPCPSSHTNRARTNRDPPSQHPPSSRPTQPAERKPRPVRIRCSGRLVEFTHHVSRRNTTSHVISGRFNSTPRCAGWRRVNALRTKTTSMIVRAGARRERCGRRRLGGCPLAICACFSGRGLWRD